MMITKDIIYFVWICILLDNLFWLEPSGDSRLPANGDYYVF